MRRLTTLLSLALLPVCLFAAAPEKQDKPATVEKVGGIPLDDLQIYGIWAVDRNATVLLVDSSGKNLLRLGFEPDANGSRLISASLEAGGKQMKVVALLDGKERTLIRPIANMPAPDQEAVKAAMRMVLAETMAQGAPIMHGGFGSSTTRSSATKKSSPESSATPTSNRGRGPSEEDRKKYESLSDGAKEKFRDGMRKMFADEKFREAPEEERRNAIRDLFDKIQKDDSKP
ncbi:MAG: hypothetical protein JNN17_00070 [Verrucomicrobiaceae bacterium]|nr:hypothetical protein [Verrucomicrobiaceae bacterium]